MCLPSCQFSKKGKEKGSAARIDFKCVCVRAFKLTNYTVPRPRVDTVPAFSLTNATCKGEYDSAGIGAEEGKGGREEGGGKKISKI